jgi:hypothetical protein
LKKLALFSYSILATVSLAQGASAASIAEENGWIPIHTVIPRPVDMRAVLDGAKTGKTIPTFTSSIESPLDGKTYNFTIVGSDPTKAPKSTTVKYFPIAIRWHFPGGVVIDPTKPGCNDTVSVANRFFNSPLFTSVPNTSNGVRLPKTQTTDAFQIAEFYKYTKNSDYHVLLSSTEKNVTVVDETAPSGSTAQTGACSGTGHDLGEIPIDSYDSILQALNLKYTKSASILPVVLSYNIVESEGGCCILGYHSVMTNHDEPQPYATAAYSDPGIFGASDQDIWDWQSEIGDIFNDPFFSNATPAWSVPGTSGSCQNQLEVGAAGTPNYEIAENGFTYHLQELVFFSWFFREQPSIGTGGKYSYKGTLNSVEGACS